MLGLCWQWEHVYTLLINPIHINSESEEFLTDRQVRISDLENIELYYIGYERVNLELSPIERTKVDTALYVTYIGNQLVICEYLGDVSKAPKTLSGKEYKCYCKRVHNAGYYAEVQHKLINSTPGLTTDNIADQIIYVFTPKKLLIKKLRAFIYIGVMLISFILALKYILLKLDLKRCKQIREVIERYGDLDEILQEIEKEECLQWNEDMFVTNTWFVHGPSKQILNCEDIVWLYHKSKKYWLIEYSWTYIYTSDYQKYKFFSWEKTNIFSVYDKILEKRPEIVRGYSETMHNKWIDYTAKGGSFKNYIEQS